MPEPLLWSDDSPVCDVLSHGVPIDAHFHDHGQLRFAASGALVTATNVGTWVAPANRITWVPAFSVHGGRSYGETRVRLLRVPTSLAEQLPPSPCVFVASPLLREACAALIDEDEPRESPRARLLLDVVLAELARAPQDALRLSQPNDPRLRAVTNLLQADPASPATLTELGRRTGSSERTLSRLFGSELSMSFYRWRTLLRIQCAVVELCKGASVTDTAMLLGWSNPSSFIEAFTELVGQTPGRYRVAARAASA